MLLLACESVACPVFSIGIDVPSGCSCSRGLHGEIVAEAWVPFYSGNCGEAANTVTGPPCSRHSFPISESLCQCSPGYQRAGNNMQTQVTQDAPLTEGPDTSCVAAPCPPHSIGESVAAGCDCEPGYSGIITAKSLAPNIRGSPWIGRCRARVCPASTRGDNLTSGCVCLPNSVGQIIATAVPPDFFTGSCTEDEQRLQETLVGSC